MNPSTFKKIPEFFKTYYTLSSQTRINTGGMAQFYSQVNTLKELKQTITFSKENDLPFYVLGNGSNVLINDDEFEGIVISLGDGFKSFSFDYRENKILADGGVSLMQLGSKIAEHGHEGYTYMGVIPGTVGGAVTMNAGINDDEKIQNNFLSARIFDPETLKEEECSPEEMDFGYRKSAIKTSSKIIIESTFFLPEKIDGPTKKAREALKQLIDLRRSKQPQNSRTFGSTFKNPKDSSHSAGWLLEKSGMKELKSGGAMVSREHANWIINLGNATSSDIKYLIETGQKRVFEEFGISLDREVIFLPEDILGRETIK
jgi:UDP-N-acetylmuramate dehydrogenase